MPVPLGVAASSAPPGYNQGYSDQLYKLLRGSATQLQLVKLGCGGETTTTFVSGEICRYDGLAQFDEAIAFVRAHRDAMSLITVDLGANDVIECIFALDRRCFDAGLAVVEANLPPLLDALHDAAGDGTLLVGMTYYDVFVGTPAKAMVDEFNAALEEIYAASDVPVADVAGAFAANPSATCSWTWWCSKYGDIHANTAGYGVIASAFADLVS